MKHGGRVNSIAFSRDGRLIATGGANGTVRVWDPLSPTEWMHISPFASGTLVRSVAFSPGADLLVAGGDDFTVRLFDVKNRQPAGNPLVGSTPVMSVAFSPVTGDRIAVGGLNGTIQVLDARNLQLMGEPIVAHPNTINSVAFNAAGDRIVSGGVDNTVRVWDAFSHKPIGTPLVGHHGSVSTVAFNQDGTRIVSGKFRWFGSRMGCGHRPAHSCRAGCSHSRGCVQSQREPDGVGGHRWHRETVGCEDR